MQGNYPGGTTITVLRAKQNIYDCSAASPPPSLSRCRTLLPPNFFTPQGGRSTLWKRVGGERHLGRDRAREWEPAPATQRDGGDTSRRSAPIPDPRGRAGGRSGLCCVHRPLCVCRRNKYVNDKCTILFPIKLVLCA